MMEPRTRAMTPREQRLVAVLLELQTELAPVIDQITAGRLTDHDALSLAGMFDMIIRDLRPAVAPPDDTDDAGSR